jgi:hypothetical protein
MSDHWLKTADKHDWLILAILSLVWRRSAEGSDIPTMSSFFNSFKKKKAAGDKPAATRSHSFVAPKVPPPPPPAAAEAAAVAPVPTTEAEPTDLRQSQNTRGTKSDLEYNDNDLNTQLVTALNEIESLRIQRDSLKEELEVANKEVDELKEQLLSSMSETKKVLNIYI